MLEQFQKKRNCPVIETAGHTIGGFA